MQATIHQHETKLEESEAKHKKTETALEVRLAEEMDKYRDAFECIGKLTADMDQITTTHREIQSQSNDAVQLVQKLETRLQDEVHARRRLGTLQSTETAARQLLENRLAQLKV